MITVDRKKFELIKSKYGDCSSWAVWDEASDRPKSNVGNLEILDPDKNDQLLGLLNPNVVMVGLNISGPIRIPLGNFHSSSSSAQDYKIRYAFQDTPFWGAYMTDIIKDFEDKISGNVRSYLKKNPSFVSENIQIFHQELRDLEVKTPLIIAFGDLTYEILTDNLSSSHNIKKVTHCSYYTIGKEKYRDDVSLKLSS
ncbi:hypothetical protein SAMN05660420_01452 [Desulfuromusa kysingii]|uniref:Uracil DNA glycosylase superfamily protein n=1 Tax=Desulfuromusa kysingii TaxID=37625 RepID=A0A1H3YYW0_9BACT|nr:hypothetical protein [Desulfuromusa kysingii]SEA16719.1 hypothetical protein SAMN05660420_01452 [Desulfuromusa kysingii]